MVRYSSDSCVLLTDRRAEAAVCTAGPNGSAVAVVFEGILDNREELAREFLPDRWAVANEADVVAAMYRRSGDGYVRRLLGDFRICIYDERQDTLVACIDFARMRGLWWRRFDGHFGVASSIGSLFASDETPPINRRYFAEYLCTSWIDGLDGPFEGVHRLAGGESLRVSRKGQHLEKYWTPELPGTESAQSDDFYAGQFANALVHAVETTLPQNEPVVCDLSGGLDSSAIVHTAAALRSDRTQSVVAFTVGYPGARTTDETRWANEVARQSKVEHHVVYWDDREPMYNGIAECAFHWDEPRFAIHSVSTSKAKAAIMADVGAKRVLSGSGAESVFSHGLYWPTHLVDDFVRLRLTRVLRGVRPWTEGASGVSLLSAVFHSCLMPLFREHYSKQQRRRPPVWVTDGIKNTLRESEEARPRRLTKAGSTIEWITDHWRGSDNVSDRGYGAFRYETRYPFLQRPLVESVFAMPWSVRLRPREDKNPLKLAMRGRLPVEFQTKESLTCDEAVSRALHTQVHHIDRILSSSVLPGLGLVNPHDLKSSITRAQHGLEVLPPLLTTLAADLWLRDVLSGNWLRRQPERLHL